jgi:hypothetical protein
MYRNKNYKSGQGPTMGCRTIIIIIIIIIIIMIIIIIIIICITATYNEE